MSERPTHTHETFYLRDVATGEITPIHRKDIHCYTTEEEHGLLSIEMKGGIVHIVTVVDYENALHTLGT